MVIDAWHATLERLDMASWYWTCDPGTSSPRPDIEGSLGTRLGDVQGGANGRWAMGAAGRAGYRWQVPLPQSV
jgi:hypothetical protein